ncbi:VOC family protein [soil metagenome]
MNEMVEPAQVKSILYPVANLAGVASFYEQVFGLSLAFQDGDRYAAFVPAAGVRLALTAGTESLVEGIPMMSLLVADLTQSIELAVRCGGSVRIPPQDGPHERRAVIDDPSGNPVVVYEKLSL